MKTIYKLVLKSYLGPMVLTFFIIMFVLMMNVLWRYIDELVGKGLDPGTIIELLCYATINMIPMALPLATLLGMPSILTRSPSIEIISPYAFPPGTARAISSRFFPQRVTLTASRPEIGRIFSGDGSPSPACTGSSDTVTPSG